MTGWAPRRFWTTASVATAEGGFTVQLDAKPVRTPRKAPLILPTEGLAQAVAAEWLAVDGTVNPAVMPFTRGANTAIDTVTPQIGQVAAMLASYGGSDLLCYRAEGPEPLVAGQAAAWDPLLAWAEATFAAPLVTTAGVMPVAQNPASLAALAAPVRDLSPFHLAAFHDLVALSGSLVLALAVIRDRLPADEAWALSRLDEDWQIGQWGEDEDAAAVALRKQADFLQADRFFRLCG